MQDEVMQETPEAAFVPEATTPPVAAAPQSLSSADLEMWKQQVVAEANESARKTAQSWADKALRKERERQIELIRQADEPFNDPNLDPYFGNQKEALRERRRAAFIAKSYQEPIPTPVQPEVNQDEQRIQTERWAAAELQKVGLQESDPEYQFLHPSAYLTQQDWMKARDAAVRLKAARTNPPAPAPVPTPAPAPVFQPVQDTTPPVIVDVTGGKGVATNPTIESYSAAFDAAMEAGDRKKAAEMADRIREIAMRG